MKHVLIFSFSHSPFTLLLACSQTQGCVLERLTCVVKCCTHCRFEFFVCFTVHFRIIPIQPNMMPNYGSMTIYVDVSTFSFIQCVCVCVCVFVCVCVCVFNFGELGFLGVFLFVFLFVFLVVPFFSRSPPDIIGMFDCVSLTCCNTRDC